MSPTHLVATDPAAFPEAASDIPGFPLEMLAGRAMLVRRAEMLPHRVHRPRLSRRLGLEGVPERRATMHGTAAAGRSARVRSPPRAGLHAVDEGDRGPRREHLATRRRPTSSVPTRPAKAREICLAAYERGAARALERGIVIADTKFELGFIDGELAICDEILTPDSSAGSGPARCLGTRHDAAVVRQAAGARLGREHRLGQGVGAAADAREVVAATRDALRRRLRADHRASARRLVRRRHVKFTAVVEITGREGIADPEGQTIERALPALGFEGVEHVRVGKVDPVRRRSPRRDRRAGTGGVALRPAAGQSRHRTGFDPLRSRAERLVRAFASRYEPALAVVYFPGSNCEHDVAAVWTSLGGTAELVWHTSTSLGGRGRCRAARRLRPRRLSPARRDRPLLAGHGRRRRALRPRVGRSSESATASRC